MKKLILTFFFIIFGLVGFTQILSTKDQNLFKSKINSPPCLTPGNDLVVNGDFTSGNVGFTSGFSYLAGCSPGGIYGNGVSINYYDINPISTCYPGFTDRNLTNGMTMHFADVQGINPGQIFWSQTIIVTPNTNYNLSIWVLEPPANCPYQPLGTKFDIYINNVLIMDDSVGVCNSWNNKNYFWNSGVNNNAIIEIRKGTNNFNLGLAGMDFELDGISFKQCIDCPNATLTSNILQSTCTSSINSATITVTGAGTIIPTATWSPLPGQIGPSQLTASNLPVGITTVQLGFGFPVCNKTYTINILPPPPAVTFSINSLNGYSITCNTTTLNFSVASSYTYGTLSYSWASLSFTANTNSVSISQTIPSLTVTAIDPLTGCSSTKTLSIGINTLAPINAVNPPAQFITCTSGVPITFSGTATSPTINIQHNWYSPLNPLPGGVPIATSNNSIGILSGLIPPGIYTLVTENTTTGCKTIKTVTVTSLDAWPTFSINCPTNFSVGCSPLHQTTISIINPVSTQTPPATCSYTFLPPGFAGTLTNGPYSANTSTSTTVPGTWTVIVNDNSNSCKTILSVPIIQNTVAPNVSAIILQQTLTCYQPTLLATGTSSTPNTIITWNIPQAPSLLSTPTVEIGPITGPGTSTTSLTYANYTVIATNSVNACQSTSVLIINQNFKPPISSPTISVGTPTAIYCSAGEFPVILTTGNSTTTSGGGPTAFVANPCWNGPSPQTSTCGPSSYSCFVAGIYSLTIMDNYNGCLKTGTIQVLDKTQPPILSNSIISTNIDCGNNEAKLTSGIVGSTANLLYWYYLYPQGAAFSPTSAIKVNGNNFLLSGTPSSSINVSLPGLYQYVVTNTITGCATYGSYSVIPGSLDVDFIPNITSGYAPLTVIFTPTNYNGLNGITNIWSFGNGFSQTTNSNLNPEILYNSPGNYTVMLISTKGNCIDTVYKIIKIEIPSKLEIPNIFTPNGDGSNDVFFLKTANLGEINAIIFDRWGNKVYEVNSLTGNIAWDGKNLNGKDCTAGVYFYVITARGNDSKDYKLNGNVSLFR